MFIDGVVINKHNTIYTNGNTYVTKINKLLLLLIIIVSRRKKNIQLT